MLNDSRISLHNIEEVLIIGHSYSEVDFPYFTWLAKKCKKANWLFGVHKVINNTYVISVCNHIT